MVSYESHGGTGQTGGGDRGTSMIAYWYHDGKMSELEAISLNQLTAFSSPIPINAQLYVPQQPAFGQAKLLNQWYQVNARNRLVPVPIGVCKELRANLLLLGVPV
jgi:hypothetical protein